MIRKKGLVEQARFFFSFLQNGIQSIFFNNRVSTKCITLNYRMSLSGSCSASQPAVRQLRSQVISLRASLNGLAIADNNVVPHETTFNDSGIAYTQADYSHLCNLHENSL